MSDTRNCPRTQLSVRVKVVLPNDDTKELWSRDISDEGVFLLTDNVQDFAIGLRVKAQVQGLPVDAPVLELEVVKHEKTGIGLIYL